jgi:hypothetical protein
MLKLPSTGASRLNMRTSDSRDCPVKKRRLLPQDPRAGQLVLLPFHGAVTDNGHTGTKTQPGAEQANRAVQYLRREQMESAGHLELDKAAHDEQGQWRRPDYAHGSRECRIVQECRSQIELLFSIRRAVACWPLLCGEIVEIGAHPKRSPNRLEWCLRNLTPMRSPATASAAWPCPRWDQGEMR